MGDGEHGDMNLNSKRVLVTGATGHLGKAICLRLASAGATVLINGRSREALEALKGEIESNDDVAQVLAFDIADAAAVEEAFQEIDAINGGLDGLVNNAYSGPAGSWESVQAEDFEKSLHMILLANFLISKLAYGLMKKAGQGSIVNISSMYGSVSPDPRIYGDSGMNNPPQYGAGKAGLLQMTRYLACHWGADGVRVNAISPGPFPTEAAQSRSPEFIKELVHRVPLARLGEPAEVSGAVQFLLSDAASYITGANLPVDGGWTAW